jgi:predicted transcriptional regulator of viral defense system
MTPGPEHALYQTAASQGGFFTAWQATAAGYSSKNHVYHVRAGHWIREWRGLYRLARYPLADDWQYSLWGVWSMNRRGEILGAYSHETALSLHELSDLQPSKMHMTVPRSFRRHSWIPPILQLHFADVPRADCEQRSGYWVTRPARTLADVVSKEAVAPEFLKQAVAQALRRGIVTRTEYESLRSMPRIGKRLRVVMEGES